LIILEHPNRAGESCLSIKIPSARGAESHRSAILSRAEFNKLQDV
jgi:hypothetical protein